MTDAKRCLRYAFSTTLIAAPAGAQPEAPRHDPSAAVCQLELVGKFIEKLVLTDKQGTPRELDGTRPILSLPPGEYRVSQVKLTGGYSSSAASQELGWFTLSPDKPYQLQAGPPLTPHVDVTRHGRLLNLDYKLLDAGGRNYVPAQHIHPPQFTICQAGREIGAGSFEYG